MTVKAGLGALSLMLLAVVPHPQGRYRSSLLQLKLFQLPVRQLPVLTASEGKLYVLDPSTNRLFICNENGLVLRTVGSIGSGPGQFFRPSAISASRESLVVLDRGNDRVEVFSLQGIFQSQFSVGGEVRSLAAGDNGLIYVNDPQSGHLVTVFDEQGRVVRSFGSLATVSGLYGTGDGLRNDLGIQASRVWLAVGNAGNVYAAHIIAPVVTEYSSKGTLLSQFRIGGTVGRQLSEMFFAGARQGVLMEIIDGKLVPVIVKGIGVDRRTGQILVLTSMSRLFVFSPGLRQTDAMVLRGAPDAQLFAFGVDARTVWIVRGFLPGAFRVRLPAAGHSGAPAIESAPGS